jgi:hypothetical protein
MFVARGTVRIRGNTKVRADEYSYELMEQWNGSIYGTDLRFSVRFRHRRGGADFRSLQSHTGNLPVMSGRWAKILARAFKSSEPRRPTNAARAF